MENLRHPDRTLALYFTEVGTHALPTKAEEVQYFKAYAAAHKKAEAAKLKGERTQERHAAKERDALGQHIACWYLRFVIREAHRRTKDKVLLKELIGWGNVGLMKGIQKFDVKRGNRFLTFGSYWIRVMMQEHLPKVTEGVHVPSQRRKEMRKLKREEDRLMALGLIDHGTVEEPTLTALDPNIRAGESDTEARAIEKECDLLSYMLGAGLSVHARFVLIHYFGLRDARPKTLPQLTQLLYEVDGSYVPADRLQWLIDLSLRTLKDHLEDQGIDGLTDLFSPV
jgi:RNA polymerase sigma factor (sigma-70 family)